ncbi:hypothetical protein GCM10020331_074230 [Ectobacillus funiculus]
MKQREEMLHNGKKIADFSHHNSVDWSKAKDELDLAIIRVQYGSTTIDTKI